MKHAGTEPCDAQRHEKGEGFVIPLPLVGVSVRLSQRCGEFVGAAESSPFG